MIILSKIIPFVFILIWFAGCVNSWRSCGETFCGRVRRSPQGYPQYSLDLENLIITPTSVEGTLVTDQSSKNLRFSLLGVNSGSAFGIRISKVTSTVRRKKVKRILPSLLDLEDQLQSFPLTVRETTSNTVTVENGNSKAIIYGKPFKVEFYSNDKLVSVANSRNRLVYELDGNNTAIAMDVSFVNAQRAYGIPLHAERLSLQNTGPGGLDPYRLFNINYGMYKIKSTEALHGAVPVIYGHGTKQSSGILWYNFAQTWVDVTVAPNQVDSFFMSETSRPLGLRMLIFTGPTLAKAIYQYAAVSGVPYIPHYFALGYHQSRQSYMTQSEVLDVVKQFDKFSLPLDAVWLDIDYTENNKFFTWDPDRFPKPLELQSQLAASNRNLVVAINPQIKAERGYFLHDNATIHGYYVRNPGGSDYLGMAEPGMCGYFDFTNAEAAVYYMTLLSTDAFKGKNIFIWNNMNEPAVFENIDHENTMPGDLEHDGTAWDTVLKHREVHNLFGTYQAAATHAGLNVRHSNWRPFALTRSHFVVTQVYAAVWTGDIYASWEYLEISFPMCLTEAIAGFSFCGADVGGFYGSPDDELYQRWYQAAAWLPFYRGNSARDVPRREPYLYSDGIQSRIRTALNQRYAHLPIWYTLFMEHLYYGEPVIRPITYHYPTEDDALSIDNEILVGANILAAPVLKQGAFVVPVYLPGGHSEIWYNIDDNYKVLAGTGYHQLQVSLSSVPVFYRGGSIIARKDIPRQSTVATHKDPYTLYICLDKNNQANGTLYVDDYETFNFAILKEYLYLGFTYSNYTFSSHKIHLEADYDGAAGIGQMIILSPPKNIVGAKFVGENDNNNYDQIKLTYSNDKAVLTINNILLSLREPFQIEFFLPDSQS